MFWVASVLAVSSITEVLIGATRSRISYHLRNIYSICMCCWNGATHKWKVHNGKIVIYRYLVKRKEARSYNFTFRYEDDVLSILNNYVDRIYPIENEIKDTTERDKFGSYLDLQYQNSTSKLRTCKHLDVFFITYLHWWCNVISKKNYSNEQSNISSLWYIHSISSLEENIWIQTFWILTLNFDMLQIFLDIVYV
jgi:hypothetical protein